MALASAPLKNQTTRPHRQAMSLDADRLAGLARTKLEGLVRRAFPDVQADAVGFNAGVGLVDGDRAFVLLIQRAPSPLAAALAWGEQYGATELHVVVDDPDPMLALEARGLAPQPTLWHAVGTELVAMPDPGLASVAEAPLSVLAQIPTLEAAGCEVVIEHGVVIGEVLGLEIARVAVEADGQAVVRVGVGLYDQEAHALVHAHSPVDERLRDVSAEVRRYRNADARPHPLNRVARERWLRSIVCSDPGLLQLDSCVIEAPIVARGGIHEQRPVAARGTRGSRNVLVVCSSGIDLDLVPTAAAHLAHGGLARADEVLLVLPQRDHHAVIERMLAHLAVDASLVAIADPWP